MEPPTYEEASLHPPSRGDGPADIPPPPSYDASLSPSTPPPSYGEAVTIQPNPFPVLTPPGAPADGTPPAQNIIIHPSIQICVTQPGESRRAQPPVVVVSQPPASPGVSVAHLASVPAVVRCPHCQRSVTTRVKHQPGRAAWTMCIFLTSIGLICGFCLIPLMIQGLQDVHHYCPECEKHIHTHIR